MTRNPSLLDDQIFNIRSGSGSGASEIGNASFGTAVEVDGVRLSNNGSFASFSTSGVPGVTVNNVASTNIESIEVITGVPSVEYGDMTSGVVKINTRKGRTPYTVTLSTNPNMKQVSASKGFGLGETKGGASKGILNASLEYTISTKDQRSPYESYDRKQLQLTYSNLFDRGILSETPLRFSVSASGNLGGMDTKADPDAFSENRTTVRDNSFRGNFDLDWLLSKKWITNIEFSGSVVYSDKNSREHESFSLSQATAAIHGRENGYFGSEYYSDNPNAAVILRPGGYGYQTMCVDDRPINYGLKLKANWARQFGEINNKLKVGVDWSADGNFGIGQYTENMETAPDFWEYRYCDIPFMNNVAAYIEENITIPIGKTRLNVIAGLRNDNTIIRNSVYGTTSSLSPRFNLKYTILSPKDRWNKTVRELSFRASWGVATKLPSYSILYPVPTYQTVQTFRSTTTSTGSAFYSYYILPRTIDYNPELKWQKNQQAEIGFDMDIAGNKISLVGYYNRTLDAYRLDKVYDLFTYNYTSTDAANSSGISAENRIFKVDRETGEITVSDASGNNPDAVLPYTTRRKFVRGTAVTNGINPITRYGIEWIIDFKRIQPINTTIRFDGSYYAYRGISKNIVADYLESGTSYSGDHYPYVGYYLGDNKATNGSERKQLSTNLTITTHIPKVRMIVSLKLEATLLRYSRALSVAADGGERSFAISNRDDILSFSGNSIYDGRTFTVTFPEYYVSVDNPSETRNYLEDLLWARDNDPNMYSDLYQLAKVSSHVYIMEKNYITPYFSMNFSVTKEIGDIASISFYANNFFNNFGQVRSSQTGNYSLVTSYIPKFYYGLTLRLKF